jgi:dTDP-glucose pyrophosphorylase
MKKTTLVIMAAGIGSRFGGGIKQLEPIGPNNELIIHYSIYDAIKAGFNKVVFVIRKELEEDFKTIIGNKISNNIEVEYVYQDINNLPDGFIKPENRTKPWGTGQAILACKKAVKEPFVVINADDYYGQEAFKQLHDYIVNLNINNNIFDFCMAGFIISNTLSENGTVTRGICKIDKNNFLLECNETKNIQKKNNIIISDSGNISELNFVSMNMWGLTPDFICELEKRFVNFLENLSEPEKEEFLLPIIIDNMIKEKIAKVKLLKTNDKWFGVTYKEDTEYVKKSINSLIENNIYPKKLF